LIASSALALFLAIFSVRSLARDDAATDKRVMELAAELRCLVCQNQSLGGVRTPALGRGPAQPDPRAASARRREASARVLDFMVARYGDFVL